jgi:hypothetical protein
MVVVCPVAASVVVRSGTILFFTNLMVSVVQYPPLPVPSTDWKMLEALNTSFPFVPLPSA